MNNKAFKLETQETIVRELRNAIILTTCCIKNMDTPSERDHHIGCLERYKVRFKVESLKLEGMLEVGK